ncbi:MAG: hypothetical protein RLZ29_596, partial [Actinomycetota bacterium]
GVLEALLPHFAAFADFFGFTSRCATLRKKEIGVDA